jgi:hypothetical protein
MNDLWWCVNCLSVVRLDVHGRCENCKSEALDVAVHDAGEDIPRPEVRTPKEQEP